jgi:bifunctional NMN adenylyltransferase/nudix hydrolase
MQLKFDMLAYIGRFQPYHLGHELVIKEALSLSERLVILIGSSNQPRTPKNPWSFAERKEMILQSLPIEDRSRVSFEALRDRPYNEEQWIESVQHLIHKNRRGAQKVSLIGYTKDESSYYLRKFPQFAPHVEAPVKETINATDLRIAYFKKNFMSAAPLYLPPNVIHYL